MMSRLLIQGDGLARKILWPRDLHYWATCFLFLAAIPLLRYFNLPFQFDWAGSAFQFWVLLAARAIFAAVILFLIGFPATAWIPILRKFFQQKARVVLFTMFSAGLCWGLGWRHGLLAAVDFFAILEFRAHFSGSKVLRATANVLLPAAYLFAGLLLVSAYNNIIASSRFFAAADPLFNAMDQRLMGGLTVSHISHWALGVISLTWFRIAEFIYYSLFSQIGAALILTAVVRGRRRSLQFVGTVLLAYYLALGLFYFWPSQGPYFLCPNHFSRFPASLDTYHAQQGSIAAAQARWNHQPLERMSFDYYIAFPCMHIAQPLVVLWFLWPWTRIRVALAIYDILLLAAILLLEWHYVVDILGGVIVAIAAIAVSEGNRWWRNAASRDHDVTPLPERTTS